MHDRSIAHTRLSFGGAPGKMVELQASYLLLTLATLGIYHFWGKSKKRAYLWSRTLLDGEPWEYRGHGKELFVGFLTAVAVLIPIIVLFQLGAKLIPVEPRFRSLLDATLVGICLLFLRDFARHRALRYLVGRSAWKGVCGILAGSSARFARSSLGLWAITLATLGITYPLLRERQREMLLNNLWLGSQPLEYQGGVGAYYRSYLLCWLLAIPTLGLSMLWFRAHEYRITAARCRLGGLRFALEIVGSELLWLRASNVALVLLTFGVGATWARGRTLGFFSRHLQVLGQLEGAEIIALERPAEVLGEGFAAVLGVAAD
jgi:uncharacterized membrane protein YjgN (DUF898 family)